METELDVGLKFANSVKPPPRPCPFMPFHAPFLPNVRLPPHSPNGRLNTTSPTRAVIIHTIEIGTEYFLPWQPWFNTSRPNNYLASAVYRWVIIKSIRPDITINRKFAVRFEGGVRVRGQRTEINTYPCPEWNTHTWRTSCL